MKLGRLVPALALSAILILTGCSRESTPAQTTPDPQGQSTEAQATAEPPYWEGWSDPFTQEEAQALETRAAAFWEESMDWPSRYKEVSGIQGYYLAPDQWAGLEELSSILQNTQGLDRDALEEGTAGICRVDFTVWYQPETYYLGPQYGDRAIYIYLLVYADETKEPQYLSAWYTQDVQTERPADPQAAGLGLNGYQYDILLHQCRALALAGITDFSTPADWSAQELARYLVVRGRDFGMEPEEWMTEEGHYTADMAGLIMAVDFTGEDEWYSTQDPSALETITEEDWQGALTALEAQEGTWTYESGKDQVLARFEGADGTKAEYTFSLCPGFEDWNSRTFCTLAKSL